MSEEPIRCPKCGARFIVIGTRKMVEGVFGMEARRNKSACGWRAPLMAGEVPVVVFTSLEVPA